MSDQAPTVNYRPDGEVLREFMRSNAFGRMLRGPVGSGKSAAGCVEIIRRASQQKPSPLNGKRMTRFAVVRNTFPELKTTTMKTWLDWFPEEIWGPVNWTAPFVHRIQIGDIDCEVIFLALDKPDDVAKLLSLELTGGWINEGREIPKQIFDGISMRVGRFPSMRHGGPTWFGWWSDTNPPDDDHWWPIMEGIVPPPDYYTESDRKSMVRPKEWDFFAQPGAMLPIVDAAGNITDWQKNPDAENMNNLHPDYYPRLIQGKTSGWIKVYVGNQIGGVEHDLAVYKNWITDTHVAKGTLLPLENVPLTFGWDFGLTPGCVIGQWMPNGRLVVLKEIYRENSGAERFCKTVFEEMRKDGRFDAFLAEDTDANLRQFTVWGDPAGDQRAQTDEVTPFTILNNNGFRARPAPTNDPGLRIDAVDALLTTMIDGHPGYLVDPSCRMLIRGFEGKYMYEQSRTQSKDGEHRDTPKKNKFSHLHDANQYLCSSNGEINRMMSGRRRGEEAPRRNPNTNARKSPFERQRERRRRLGVPSGGFGSRHFGS